MTGNMGDDVERILARKSENDSLSPLTAVRIRTASSYLDTAAIVASELALTAVARNAVHLVRIVAAIVLSSVRKKRMGQDQKVDLFGP